MTVYLVRHASAGDRSLYAFDDLERPLDGRGHDQAAAICATLLDELTATMRNGGNVRLVSSLATRCQQTLEPLAGELGLQIESSPAFTEGALGGDTMVAMAELADHTAVVCSHGDVLPELVRRLMLDSMRVTGRRGCEKGSIWRLETTGRDYVRGQYLGVPDPM